jgi:LysM repeat protein
MKQWQRLLFYLMVNIFVSALTTWIVLTIWDRTQSNKENQGVSANLPASVGIGGVLTESVPSTTSNMQPGMSAIASPSTPTPWQNVEEYQVQANETMGEIAARYGVSVEELLAVNGLTDPDTLSPGMVLYVPIAPDTSPTDDTSTSATSAPQPTGSPMGSSQEAGVVINSVIGAGDLASERVFISRTGGGVLLIEGWKLMDEDGNVFTFPTLDLFEGGAVNVWTTTGSPTVIDLYWSLQNAVWKSGERVTLLDAQGKVRAVYRIP